VVHNIMCFIRRYRTQKLQRDKELLEEEVAERTAEIVKQKEEIETKRDELSDKNYQIELKNKDITDSINYAKRIQDAILPAIETIREGFPDSFVLYYPKDIVSGDFYWCCKRKDQFFIAAVDCTGHGVPGAFMSMIGQNLLNKIVIDEGHTDPGTILQQLNNGVKFAFSASQKEMAAKDGMDIALISYRPSENKIIYAGANRPLYFVRNNELEEIKATKSAIGGYTPIDFNFNMHEFTLQKGDLVYITSDGYADQFGGKEGKKFMTKKLKELLISNHTQSMDKQKEMLDSNLQNWKMGYDQVDDVLVIGIRF
jgi:serine phosphatase RsbU (regulator of sigma subunit)